MEEKIFEIEKKEKETKKAKRSFAKSSCRLI
jgi:hypothetical protein